MGLVLRIAKAGAGLLALASAAAGFLALGGAVSSTLDGFAQLAPLWSFTAVVALASAVVFRARTMAALALVALASALALIAPSGLQALRAPRPPLRPADLTLVQFNLWALNRDPSATAAWILAQRPDVVAIEEVEGRALAVRDRLEAAGYRSAGRCAHRPRCRSLVLSRWPMLGGDSLARAPDWISASHIVVASPQGPVAVTAAHTGWPWPADRARSQRRALVEAEGRLAQPCRIVAGDFNASPWSFGLQGLERSLGLKRRTRIQPTWPARATTGVPVTPPFPVFAIDHVFASACWKASRVAIGPRLGSDHYPVLVQLWR